MTTPQVNGAGHWRPVLPGEVFPPGRRFDMNVSAGGQARVWEDAPKVTLASLADLRRWVAWQTERNPEGRVTKVPKAPGGGNAKSDSPRTWGSRSAAEARAAQLPKPHGLGGVGFELGVDADNGRAFGGLDLDSCRNPETGEVEPWAGDIIRRLGSYTEVSPSGTGVKVFFQYDPAALPDLLRVMQSKGGRKWTRGKGEHPPGIELYLTGRYFATTFDRLADSPDHLRNVSRATLEQLIRVDGPAFAGQAQAAPRLKPATPSAAPPVSDLLTRAGQASAAARRLLAGDRSGLKDSSRSGLAMALGGALKRAGWTFDAVADVLRTWSETADWCAEKGDANGGRELRRLWDHAGEAQPATGGAEFPPVLATKATPGRLRLLSPGGCAESTGRDYVIKGLLAAGDVGCLFGPPGCGKSILAPHLAYRLVQGAEVFGRRVKPGKAFYVAAEDAPGMRQRVRGLLLAHGDADGFNLVEGVGNLFDKAEADELRALVAEHKPALIVIDTLAMSFPGLRENEAEDMGRVVALARSLTAHGAAVLLVHHNTKAGDGTPRGHSILNGALDVALELVKADDSGIVRGRLTKNRNGACEGDFAFRIDSVAIGEDEDGDPVTAPVAREMGAAGPRVERLPRGAAAALGVLKEQAQLVGRQEPDGRVVVPEDDWRRECIDNRRVSTSDSRDSRKKAFNRSYADLVDRGLIGTGATQQGDVVWLPRVENGSEFICNEPGQPGQSRDKSRLSRRQSAAQTGTDGTHPFKGCPDVPAGDARKLENDGPDFSALVSGSDTDPEGLLR